MWEGCCDEIPPFAGLRRVDATDGFVLMAGAHQNDLESESAAAAGKAKHRAVPHLGLSLVALRREGNAALVAGDRVPHEEAAAPPRHHWVDGEDEAVAAAEDPAAEVVEPQREAPAGAHGRGDAVGGIHGGDEGGAHPVAVEEAEERRAAAVAGAEAAEEGGVGGDEAAPARADGGGAREGGGPRREAEKYLGEEVVVFQRPRVRVRHHRVSVRRASPLRWEVETGEYRQTETGTVLFRRVYFQTFFFKLLTFYHIKIFLHINFQIFRHIISISTKLSILVELNT